MRRLLGRWCLASYHRPALAVGLAALAIAELLEGVEPAGIVCLLAATACMLLLLRLFLPRWRAALLVLLPVAAGLFWTVLVTWLLGLRFGLFNMVVLPLLVGIGVDDNLHLVEALQRGIDLDRALTALRRPIVLATATTLCGFFGFLVSANPGLRSVGTLGAVGFVATLVATLVLLPAVVRAGRGIVVRSRGDLS